MTAEEREFVVGELVRSEARLLQALDGLSAAQWRFRDGPERWSIAEVVEHLVVFEEFIRGAVRKALDGPAEIGKRAEVARKEGLVLGLAESRGTKFVAREAARPMGRWENLAEGITAFRKARAKTLEFVGREHAELRDHFFTHIVFGDLDCYQWLVVLARHVDRHVLQIEEIKRDVGYPRG
ncbi:MAG: DinB family protein [Acidobacteriota bacterium]|nr:DinB family protein [Acidobacteriota bacterium]